MEGDWAIQKYGELSLHVDAIQYYMDHLEELYK